MKFLILIMIAACGVLITGLVPHADSELASNNNYLLQASGFIVTDKTIQNSELNLQLSTEKLSSGTTNMAMQVGDISIAGVDYLSSGVWKAKLVFDGRFFTLSGDATSANGDKILASLIGRLVQQSHDGSVYLVTGKLTRGSESEIGRAHV